MAKCEKEHTTPAVAKDKLADTIVEGSTSQIPCTPVFNKFNKIYPQLSYFVALLNMPDGIGLKALNDMTGKRLRDTTAADDAQQLANASTSYLSTSDYQIQERVTQT